MYFIPRVNAPTLNLRRGGGLWSMFGLFQLHWIDNPVTVDSSSFLYNPLPSCFAKNVPLEPGLS